MTPFARYFDRVAVINLPSRPDRLKSIISELTALGFDRTCIHIPDAPIPQDNGGFPSRGVYGNFLSHLGILKDARAAGARRVLVLEDDAIFSRDAGLPAMQEKFIAVAEQFDWAMWFLGHSISAGIRSEPQSAVPTTAEFIWAHAYAVRDESLSELIKFMDEMIAQPEGHRWPKSREIESANRV